MYLAKILTSRGTFIALYSEHGLASLTFPPEKEASVSCADGVETGSSQVRRWHLLTSNALQRMLRGRVAGKLPPLDLTGATPFQRRVWSALQEIPPGQTRCYSELARAIGQPGAARAVGNACGANPIPVLIPCHRVLAKGGRLGGFSSGLKWKRFLLRQESQNHHGA